MGERTEVEALKGVEVAGEVLTLHWDGCFSPLSPQ